MKNLNAASKNNHSIYSPKSYLKTVGRPSTVTPEIIYKLEECFLRGLSDSEACFIANIPQSTFYNYQAKNPEFLERKQALKIHTTIMAKIVIAEAINKGCGKTSRWYLERKCPEEFSLRKIVRCDCKNRKEEESFYHEPVAPQSMKEIARLFDEAMNDS